jgi:hypothetical protein
MLDFAKKFSTRRYLFEGMTRDFGSDDCSFSIKSNVSKRAILRIEDLINISIVIINYKILSIKTLFL